MNKIMYLCFLSIFSLFMFSGCVNNDKEVDGAVGKYYFVFERGPMHYYEDLDYVMILDGKGGGEWKREDKIHKIKYEFNEPDIKIEDKLTGIRYNGTITDGELHLYDGDPLDAMTSEYMFKSNNSR